MAYHRMVSGTGLGNPSKAEMDNFIDIKAHDPGIVLKFTMAVIQSYFPGAEGIDFHADSDWVIAGIEPTYQYERLKIVVINKDKSQSFFKTGRAWGGYGSQIGHNTKFYHEYRKRSKFIKFVDEWHPKLFPEGI